MVKRHVLSMEFVAGYLKRCGAERAILDGDFRRARKLIMEGEFTAAEMRLIGEMCRDLGKYVALVARNSAFGDASGTGMLGSSFYLENNPSAAAWFVKCVIASYYAGKSVQFRRDACLAEGIAVGIEPMVESAWRGRMDARAPTFSGFGRTDSGYAGPHFGIVHGLGSEYMNDPRQGVVIIKKKVDAKNALKKSDTPDIDDFQEGCNLRSLDEPLVFAKGGNGKWEVTRDEQGDRWNFNISRLFAMMERLQQNCGGIRQYFEYAAKADGNGRHAKYISQIADIPIVHYDFKAEARALRVFGKSDYVVASGRADAEHLVVITENDGWGELSEINGKYGKYVLLFDGLSIYGSSMKGTVLKNLEYSDISNAVAIGTDSGVKNNLVEFGTHFGGLLAMAGKVLAAFESNLENLPVKDVHRSYVVYELPLRVVASEDQNQAIIGVRK